MKISNRTCKGLQINSLRLSGCGMGKMGQDIHQISRTSSYNVPRIWLVLSNSYLFVLQLKQKLRQTVDHIYPCNSA